MCLIAESAIFSTVFYDHTTLVEQHRLLWSRHG